MKTCPYCEESIQDRAAKCRYCGEWIDPSKRPSWSESAPTAPLPEPHLQPSHGSRAFIPQPLPDAQPVGRTQLGIGVQPQVAWARTGFYPHDAAPRPGDPHAHAHGHAHALQTAPHELPHQPTYEPLRAYEPAPQAFTSPREQTEPHVVASAHDLAPHHPNAAPQEVANARVFAPPDPSRIAFEPAPPRNAHNEPARGEPPHSEPLEITLEPDEPSTPPRSAVPPPVWRPSIAPAAPASPVFPAPTSPAAPGPTSAATPRAEPIAAATPTAPVSDQPHPSAALTALVSQGPRPPPPEPHELQRAEEPARAPKAPKTATTSFEDAFYGGGEASALTQTAEDSMAADPFGSQISAAPRVIPWGPLLAGVALLLLVVVVGFRGTIFGAGEEDPPPEAPPAAPPPEPSPAPVPPKAVEAPEPAPAPAPAPAPPAEDPALQERLAEARAALDKRRLKAAAPLITELVAASPDHPEVLLLSAQLKLEQGDLDGSMTSATRCVEISATQADCWLTLGILEQAQKRDDAAVKAYETYLELAPTGRYARDATSQLARLKK